IVTNDQGNFGAGGSLSATSTVAITVNAVNDAPTNTVPGAQTISEDNSLVFATANGNRISVADVDDADNVSPGDETIQVTLSATGGTLNLSGTTGLGFSSG